MIFSFIHTQLRELSKLTEITQLAELTTNTEEHGVNTNRLYLCLRERMSV